VRAKSSGTLRSKTGASTHVAVLRIQIAGCVQLRSRISAPEVDPNKLYANLGRATGFEEKTLLRDVESGRLTPTLLAPARAFLRGNSAHDQRAVSTPILKTAFCFLFVKAVSSVGDALNGGSNFQKLHSQKAPPWIVQSASGHAICLRVKTSIVSCPNRHVFVSKKLDNDALFLQTLQELSVPSWVGYL
jgi:hypothetical protein